MYITKTFFCTLTSSFLVFSFFSLSTDRHRSVVQYTVDSSFTHIWIETGLESIVFSETSAVITVRTAQGPERPGQAAFVRC